MIKGDHETQWLNVGAFISRARKLRLPLSSVGLDVCRSAEGGLYVRVGMGEGRVDELARWARRLGLPEPVDDPPYESAAFVGEWRVCRSAHGHILDPVWDRPRYRAPDPGDHVMVEVWCLRTVGKVTT